MNICCLQIPNSSRWVKLLLLLRELAYDKGPWIVDLV